jgi:hypothetical protein
MLVFIARHRNAPPIQALGTARNADILQPSLYKAQHFVSPCCRHDLNLPR